MELIVLGRGFPENISWIQDGDVFDNLSKVMLGQFPLYSIWVNIHLTLTPCVARASLWLIRSSPEMSAIENSTPAFFDSACATIVMLMVIFLVNNVIATPTQTSGTCNIATHAAGLIPPPLVTILIPCLDFKALKWGRFFYSLWFSPLDLSKMWSYGLDKVRSKSELKEKSELEWKYFTWGFLFLAAARRDMVISDK